MFSLQKKKGGGGLGLCMYMSKEKYHHVNLPLLFLSLLKDGGKNLLTWGFWECRK